MTERQALYQSIQESPADLAQRLVYSDILEEQDQDVEARLWRTSKRIKDVFKYYRSGFGNGNGRRHGDGYGYGYGFGHGHGYGHGYGSGHGYGYGHRFGYGSGHGYGYIDFEQKFLDEHQAITKGKIMIGQNLLIWAGEGFAWVGHVEEMYEPGAYRLSNAGMLCETGGISWMDVANNVDRSKMIYRHGTDGVIFTGGVISGATVWKGELPGSHTN